MTTVKQDFNELGRKAVKLVLSLVEKGEGITSEVLPVILVVRQSSGEKLNALYDKQSVFNYLENIGRLLP
ncbi:substrate-binding domain-containing protein [Vibrio alginolyticus]|nr:substrate-binding domain-containing protein [Vibrio alginolyticus]